MKKSIKTSLCATVAVVAAPGINTLAQEPNADVITVTATKRAQTLQDVPVAVSVVGEGDIEKAQIIDLIDLQDRVPSLRVDQLQRPGQTNFVIRGFGNGANNAGIETSVGVFIDGVYRSRSSSAILDLPILDRVEVLRGPQSTLFGKNVSAGAISIITKEPLFDWGGELEASYGNLDQLMVQGTATGPISDTVAFRISGSFNQRDGYYTNLLTGVRNNDRDRWSIRGHLAFQPADNLSFRLIGDYNEINETCCGAVQIVNGPATQFVGAPPPFGLGLPVGDPDRAFAYEAVYNVDPVNELKGAGVSLQSDYDLGPFVLTSITAYREQDDRALASEVDFTGADSSFGPNFNEFDTFTQELRAVSIGDGPLQWLVGGFYFNESVDTGRTIIYGSDLRGYVDGLSMGGLSTLEGILSAPTGFFFAPGQGIVDEYSLKNESYSVFSQIDFDVTDRLTLTGGIAYLNDRKAAQSFVQLNDPFANLDLVSIGNMLIFQSAFVEGYANLGVDASDPTAVAAFEMMFPGTQAQVAAGAQAFADANAANPAVNPVLPLAQFQFFEPPINFPNANENGILKDDKITYSLRAAYDIIDSVNAYFSYSTGWKAGAYNLSSDSRPPDVNGIGRTAAPEDVEVFELGLKMQFDGGYINLALFDQTIEGFQSNLFVGTGFQLANAGKQSVRGLEVESAATILDALTITFGLTYLDAEYDSFTRAPCADFDLERCGNAELFRDLTGERPAGIPEVSIATSATYTRQLTDRIEGFLRAGYVFESEVQIADNIPESAATRSVSLLNLSGGLSLSNGMELQVWARNVFDENYFISAFPTVTQPGSFTGYVNEPRTYGATLRYRF